jgi:hypothetical protein
MKLWLVNCGIDYRVVTAETKEEAESRCSLDFNPELGFTASKQLEYPYDVRAKLIDVVDGYRVLLEKLY